MVANVVVARDATMIDPKFTRSHGQLLLNEAMRNGDILIAKYYGLWLWTSCNGRVSLYTETWWQLPLMSGVLA